jgi:hypothetical protein
VNQTVENLEPQSPRRPPLDHISESVTAAINAVSILLFCLSFTSLTHLLTSWCDRLIAEK